MEIFEDSMGLDKDDYFELLNRIRFSTEGAQQVLFYEGKRRDEMKMKMELIFMGLVLIFKEIMKIADKAAD